MIHIIFALGSLHVSDLHGTPAFFPISSESLCAMGLLVLLHSSFHEWPCATWLTTKQASRNL